MTAPEPDFVGGPDAACRIYRNAPAWDGRRTAAIGGFSCQSAEAGTALLRSAIRQLEADAFDCIVGPMDGDTWHSYRLVTESDGSRPFFLEPVSGPHDLAAFEAAGFAPISSYVSSRTPIEAAIGEPAPAVPGVTIRAWDGRDAGALIGGLFDLSRKSFTSNAFYKPIEREAFLALYQPLLPTIDPRLVFFAYCEGALAGYLFALPDRLQGPQPDTAIIKTYASAMRGVGHMLADTAHRTIRDLGYGHVIHALMHESNQSKDRSRRHGGTIFRRYDLMGLTLGQRS